MLNTANQRRQRTLKHSVAFSGLGVHTGETVKMRFCPAAENTGIVFKRIDLPDQPFIPATVDHVCDTQRSTTIGAGSVRIHTIEHVMAALCAFNIDNLVIEVSNLEPPIGNGSSDVFVGMIDEAGIQEQDAFIPIIKIRKPIYWSEGEIHLAILPGDGYRISYTLSYKHPKVLQAQFYSTFVTSESFRNEMSSCRTFSLWEEVSYLMERGLIKGGSLDNAVVIKGEVVLSREGLRFPNEMARHKTLDMIGDLSLVGVPFEGHVIAIRSGHASNYQLAKAIQNYIATECK